MYQNRPFKASSGVKQQVLKGGNFAQNKRTFIQNSISWQRLGHFAAAGQFRWNIFARAWFWVEYARTVDGGA